MIIDYFGITCDSISRSEGALSNAEHGFQSVVGLPQRGIWLAETIINRGRR